MISIVFPAYNEEDNVVELHRRIKAALEPIGQTYEIIGVESGSTDGTLKKLKELHPIKIVVLAKNIGQTAALDAGLKAAKGDIVITMDADLQNDPVDIPNLLAKLNEGFDVVSGWRQDRQDTFGRRVLSRCANWLTYKVTGLKLHDHACALKAYRAQFLKGINLYGEMHVFLAAWLYLRGAKVVEIPVTHHGRHAGVSKHNFMKAVKDISDLFTIRFISNMTRPLLFFGSWGILSGFLAFVAAAAAVVLKVLEIRNFAQTPLPVLVAMFSILGFLMIMMGFLAELILRTYYETKHETQYLIKEIIEQ